MQPEDLKAAPYPGTLLLQKSLEDYGDARLLWGSHSYSLAILVDIAFQTTRTTYQIPGTYLVEEKSH